ncbi:suppressor of fused domain protein [Micromonospora orduensis]|uniref:suppressor of fused domain protein n=1 Tax=Micromonospora orduensis TaxID=1420891 RepID=UPI00142EEFD9|nr:suppressor of fused domain protein [Micromonospora orduensis]
MADLVEHLERFLGPIQGGTPGGGSTPAGVQVIRFGADAPFTGVTTWATLGLSNHHLGQQGGGGLHQELLIHLPNARQPSNTAGVLFQVAGELIERGRGLARGEVIGPRGRVFPQTEMTALAATTPAYLPDSFAVCDTPAAPTVLTWLVPLTQAEAQFAHVHGWPALEDIFVAQNPDLTDLGRMSVQLRDVP